MTLIWGWVERGHGMMSSHEQYFTVIGSSAVTQARDYDPDQSLDTRKFFLPRFAVLVAKKFERKLPRLTCHEMNTPRIVFAARPKLPSRSRTLAYKVEPRTVKDLIEVFLPTGS